MQENIQPLGGRKALVTEASRGIGRAVALRLTAAGARVAVRYARAEEAARATLSQLPSDGYVLLAAGLTRDGAAVIGRREKEVRPRIGGHRSPDLRLRPPFAQP